MRDGDSREEHVEREVGRWDDAAWEVARPPSEPLDRRWFPWAVLSVVAIATPWYLPEEVGGRFLAGLPVWVWVSLAGALTLSCLTSFGALALWRDRGALEPEDPHR